MSLIFFTCFAFLLSAIAYQDFRYGKISVWILAYLLLSIVLSWFFSSLSGNHNSLKNIAVNISFVLVLLSGVSVYLILTRGFTKIMDHYIGWGDIIFILIVTGLFSPVNFMLFCLSGFCAALILFGIIHVLRPKINREIPLAGILSVVLLLGLSLKYLNVNFNLQEDSFFLDKLALLW
jgi:hypothetical protein